MHGVTEGLDSHSCTSCHAIAVETGADASNGRTYLYRKDPRISTKRARPTPIRAHPSSQAPIVVNIDYAADDSCMIQCWARGHFEAETFLRACEAGLKAWDGREEALAGKLVAHATWRTVRGPAELASCGVCEFIHVESKPGRGAYPVTVLTDWLELHPK